MLELWQPERPSEADLANVEIAVSFAASIVSDLCRRGGRTLWMAVAAREPHWNSGPTSLALTREVMESLATAEATSADTFPEALGKTLEVARPGTNGIVISTRAVDLADTERFAKLWRNTRQRAWLGRLQSISVGAIEPERLFHSLLKAWRAVALYGISHAHRTHPANRRSLRWWLCRRYCWAWESRASR